MRWTIASPATVHVDAPFRLELVLDVDDADQIIQVEEAAARAGLLLERVGARTGGACRSCGVLGGHHLENCPNRPPQIDPAEVIHLP